MFTYGSYDKSYHCNRRIKSVQISTNKNGEKPMKHTYCELKEQSVGCAVHFVV